MMDPDTYALVSDLVSEALDLEPYERSSFLDRCCGSDPKIRREVDSLLAHESALEDGFLELPAIADMRRAGKAGRPVAPFDSGALSVQELLARDACDRER